MVAAVIVAVATMAVAVVHGLLYQVAAVLKAPQDQAIMAGVLNVWVQLHRNVLIQSGLSNVAMLRLHRVMLAARQYLVRVFLPVKEAFLQQCKWVWMRVRLIVVIPDYQVARASPL